MTRTIKAIPRPFISLCGSCIYLPKTKNEIQPSFQKWLDMSKIHQWTSGTCSVCDSELCPEISVILHKTRRQTHVLCLDCLQGYLASPLRMMIDNLRRNIRKDIQFVRCPGTYRSAAKNQCCHKVDVADLTVPPECKLFTDIFRVSYVLNSPDAHLCPNKDCGNVVDVDPMYNGNRIRCMYCESTWCRQCLVAPYHENKTCLEHEVSEQKSENAKLIWELSQQGKVKFCGSCKAPTFRTSGCNKMRCESCGAKWCWLCGKTGIDYSHFNSGSGETCAGKLWDGTR
jgi:hypothetical protein